MRFLSIYKAVERNTPPSTEEFAAMGRLVEEAMRNRTLLATEGCLPSAKGVRVRRSGEKVTVTDGPFTESKELIAGFAILQASSKAEAVEQAKQFLTVAGDGECEIRQIAEASDFGPEFTPELREHEERVRAQMGAKAS